jgi:transposase
VQDDCIAVALGLSQLKVLEQKELEDRFEVVVMNRQEEASCPRCGRGTVKEHDRRRQVKQDCRLRDKAVYLALVKRRFRCLWCGTVFSEADDVFGRRRRCSKRFREHLGEEALHQTVRQTAQQEGVGEGLVRRCVAEEVGKRLGTGEVSETPEYIGVDEFSVRKGRLFHTAVCDLVRHSVMEVIEGQGRRRLEEYLDHLPGPEKVKGVAMDMHDAFRQAVRMCLPPS